jgi:phosphoribosylformylglycinamidine synthase
MDFALKTLEFPKVVMTDKTIDRNIPIYYTKKKHFNLFRASASIRSSACKDWLTNKVDVVCGKVAKQQSRPLQLPLNNCGVMALDYNKEGIAT